jgi:hypothetical protein
MLAMLSAAMPAWGADDPLIADLALCRQSWLDWKSNDPSKLESFGAFVRSHFTPHGNDGSFTPKSAMTVDGLRVTQMFPGSIGMGLGFSVVVDASFDVAKHALERDLGKPLRDCEASDGMRSCELSIADQRTVTLAANDPPNDQKALLGCYYYYEK